MQKIVTAEILERVVYKSVILGINFSKWFHRWTINFLNFDVILNMSAFLNSTLVKKTIKFQTSQLWTNYFNKIGSNC